MKKIIKRIPGQIITYYKLDLMDFLLYMDIKRINRNKLPISVNINLGDLLELTLNDIRLLLSNEWQPNQSFILFKSSDEDWHFTLKEGYICQKKKK